MAGAPSRATRCAAAAEDAPGRPLAGSRAGGATHARAGARGAQVMYKSGCSDPWTTAFTDAGENVFPGPSGNNFTEVVEARVNGTGILARYIQFTQLSTTEPMFLRCAICAAPPHARASAGRASNALRSCADQRCRARAGSICTGPPSSPSRSGSRD